jgi:hypothetical protein
MRGRPWFAVAIAYVVAFQMLLSSAIATQMQVAAATAVDATSVICAGHEQPGDAGDTGKAALDHAPCVLCTFAKAAAGALTVELHTSPPKRVAFAVVRTAAHEIFIPYRPPVGRYQRGPPVRSSAAV